MKIPRFHSESQVFNFFSFFLFLQLLFLLIPVQGLAQQPNIITGPQINVYTGTGNQTNPYVAYDSVNGRFLVVWFEGWPNSSQLTISGKFINYDGSPIGDSFLISAATVSFPLIQAGSGNPIAFDPVNQRFLVVWPDARDESLTVYGQFINSSGGLSGENFHISPLPIPSENYYHQAGVPTVQFDSVNNKYLVVWVGPSAGLPANVFGQWVNAGGSLDGNFFNITEYAGSYYAAYPDIGFDPNTGQNFVIWGNQQDGNIYGKFINSGTPILIGNYAINYGYFASIAFDPESNNYLVVWAENAYSLPIVGQLIGTNGILIGDKIKISPEDSAAFAPLVVFDSANKKFWVTYNWLYTYERLMGRLLNPDGTFSGDQFEIPSSLSRQSIFSMAFGSGNIGSLVVWWDENLDFETYGYDISGRFVKLAAPQISVSPSSYDFGSVNVGGTSAPATFTITNSGDADLVIGIITTTGGNLSEFTIGYDNCRESTLSSSSSCTLQLVFSPASSGPKSANVSIASNDPDENPLDIPLIGTGLPSLIDLSGHWSNVSKTGPSRKGVYKITGTFTVTNSGSIKANTVVIEFYFSNDTSVDPGDELIKTVQYKTINPGSGKNTNISFSTSMDPGGKHLIASIDPSNNVKESDESNNVVYTDIP